MELNRDFSEFIASCARHDVRFLIMGGYAVAAHGHPRFTKDEQNAYRLVSALEDFGFGSLGLTAADFIEEGVVVQLPVQRIDILTQVDGVQFDSCWDRHIEIGPTVCTTATPATSHTSGSAIAMFGSNCQMRRP